LQDECGDLRAVPLEEVAGREGDTGECGRQQRRIAPPNRPPVLPPEEPPVAGPAWAPCIIVVTPFAITTPTATLANVLTRLIRSLLH